MPTSSPYNSSTGRRSNSGGTLGGIGGVRSGSSGRSGSGYSSGSSGNRPPRGGAPSTTTKREVVTPERPRNTKGSERSPAYHRRPSRTGVPTTTSNGGGSGGAVVPSTTASAVYSPPRVVGEVRHSAGSSNSGHHSQSEEGGVRVVVRVRPLSVEEEARGGERTMRLVHHPRMVR